MSKDILFSNSYLLCYGHCLMVNPVFLPVLFQGFGLSKGGRWSMSSNETVLHGPAAQFFLFLVQWTDCHLAGALGLLRILIYMVYFFPPCLHLSFSTVPPLVLPQNFHYSFVLFQIIICYIISTNNWDVPIWWIDADLC